MSLYLDTSALAKWYIAESDSDAFEEFISGRPGAHISRLTVVELRCALARRRRNREITASLQTEVLRLFETHLRDGLLDLLTVQDEHFAGALKIQEELPRLPLRTLDALHLAIARSYKVGAIATADRVMAVAGKALKFEIHAFN